MTFWLAVAALTLVALAAVLVPLLRARGGGARTRDYDIAVYRDQLAEVERNLERGLIGSQEAEAARAEIGRRILAADSRGDGGASEDETTAPARPTGRRVAAAAVALAVPLAAVGLYLQVGSPGMPAQPFAARQGDSGDRTAGEAGSLQQAERRLAERLAERPNDLDGWILLGRTRMTIGRYQGAAEAFRRAITLAPERPRLHAAYGEALTIAAGGQVTATAREAFRTALAGAPDDPRTRYYMALAAYQAGEMRRALDDWRRLAAEAEPDAPWLPAVEARLREARQALGRPSEPEDGRETAEAGTAGDGGPTQEDVAAAAQMPSDERRRMIEGMVEGLAKRLEADPRDAGGWQRLIRSYTVLGRKEDAQAALDRALATFEGAPAVRRRLIAQARELELEAPAAEAETAGDGGPTREDMAAAQQMSPDERRAMIESMVESLAARLRDNPDDLQGWLRLARSYRVLERPEKAREAYARAAELAPEDVEVLTGYARAVRAASGQRRTETSKALMGRVLELEPDNPEALWFTAMAELDSGRAEKARSLFDKALEQLPEDSPQTAELRRRVESLLEQN